KLSRRVSASRPSRSWPRQAAARRLPPTGSLRRLVPPADWFPPRCQPAMPAGTSALRGDGWWPARPIASAGICRAGSSEFALQSRCENRHDMTAMRDSLPAGHVFGFEALEQPAFLDQHALDRRVPLEGGHRIVELFDRGCGAACRRIDAKLVRRVVAVQSQFADDGVLIAAKGPPQDANQAI